MNGAINFTLMGVPVAKGRARSFIRAGHVAHYTPAKTVDYEKQVAAAGRAAMAGAKPINGAVELRCTFVMPIPVSYSKKRRAACLTGAEQHCKKPDVDNMLKAIKDGLNGVCWDDDCQVVQVIAVKVYGEHAGVRVTVREFINPVREPLRAALGMMP